MTSVFDLGGSGQRRLTVVPLDAEGYSGQQLKAASNNGKNILFLVPIQEELDTNPLPYNSAEFSQMPQVACHICSATIPLQMLTLHAENCHPTEVVSVILCDFTSWYEVVILMDPIVLLWAKSLNTLDRHKFTLWWVSTKESTLT